MLPSAAELLRTISSIHLLTSEEIARGELLRFVIGGRDLKVAAKSERSPDPRGVVARIRNWGDSVAPGTPAVLSATYIPPSIKTALEAAGLGWIESEGIHLDTAGQLIHVEGRARPPASSLNISSPAVQKTIRALLQQPEATWSLREVEEGTRIHASSASRALGRLTEQGLIDRRSDGWRVVDGAVLLDTWLEVRHASRVKPVERCFFTRERLTPLADRILEVKGQRQVAFTGRFAAEAIRPLVAASRVDIYIHPYVDVTRWAQNELRLMPLPGLEEATVVFKHSPDGGAFVGVEETERIPVVGKAQLIADLTDEGGRSDQAAEVLRKLWGLDAIADA